MGSVSAVETASRKAIVFGERAERLCGIGAGEAGLPALESRSSRWRIAALTPAAGEDVPARKGERKSWLYSEAGLSNFVVVAKDRDLARVPGVAVW